LRISGAVWRALGAVPGKPAAATVERCTRHICASLLARQIPDMLMSTAKRAIIHRHHLRGFVEGGGLDDGISLFC
jgi:hypothetical protein